MHVTTSAGSRFATFIVFSHTRLMPMQKMSIPPVIDMFVSIASVSIPPKAAAVMNIFVGGLSLFINFLNLNLDAAENSDYLILEVLHHLSEHTIGFKLVFLLRITLCVTS